jgi:hypothetical protein
MKWGLGFGDEDCGKEVEMWKEKVGLVAAQAMNFPFFSVQEDESGLGKLWIKKMLILGVGLKSNQRDPSELVRYMLIFERE